MKPFIVVCGLFVPFALISTGENPTSLQYTQTAYPIYKTMGGNAGMLSETHLSNTRTIKPDTQADIKQLAQDGLGKLIPAKSTKFAESYGKTFALSVNLKCKLSYQDVAYLRADEGKHPLMVLGYEGCPFSARELKVNSAISMREPIVIEVGHANGNVLYPASGSCVPFIVTSNTTVPCFMAVNVQWRFVQEGIKFSTESAEYKVSQGGSTVSFTEDGVMLEGIEKLPKKTQ